MRHHYFNLGKYQCCVLEDRSKVIPLIEEFDNQHHKQALHCHMSHGAADDTTEIGFNYLYLNDGKNQILLDAGMSSESLSQSMISAGISEVEIDFIIITHGDDDHVDGLSNFPNAKFIMPKRSFELWTNDQSRDRLNQEYAHSLGKVISHERVREGIEKREEFGQKLLHEYKERLILVEDQQSFLYGICMIYAPGHRSDHYCVKIQSEQTTLLAVADAFRHGFQFKRSHMASRYDADPAGFEATIEAIKKQEHHRDFIYFGTHFSFPGLMTFQDGLLRPSSIG